MFQKFINHSVGFAPSSGIFLNVSLYQDQEGKLNGAGVHSVSISGLKTETNFETLSQMASVAGYSSETMHQVIERVTKLANAQVRGDLPPVNV